MLVNQLKEELKSRGASVVGKKAELATRLEELVAQEAQESGNKNTEAAPADEAEPIQDVIDQVVPEAASEEPSAAAVVDEAPSVEVDEAPTVEQSEGSAAPHAVQEDTYELPSEETVTPDAPTADKNSDGYTHVRIDNFQRPLNQKALIEWIESLCQCTLASDALWINTIKTHCYVDFSTEEEAKRCVENVTGKKFPSSSPYILEADFTSVSAKEAPQSVEGSQKPGTWKVLSGETIAASPVSAKKQQVQHAPQNTHDTGRTITIDTEAMDTHDEAPQCSNKRKLDDTASSPTAGTSTDTPSSKTRRVAGLDIFRRATAGILLNRPGNAPSAVYDASVNPASSANAQVVTGFVSRKAREGDEPGETYTSESAATRSSDETSLEDLFRKTVHSTPAIYWLPAPDEVVQQRLKSRLMSKGTRR